MRITEIFKSIQGEGPAMGEAVTFIRLSGCNLSCEGCDTDHAPKLELSPKEIQYRVHGRCVITGGEPCLHPDLLALANLLTCDLETNGTIPINPSYFRHCVISPKRGSKVDFAHWMRYDNTHFKFVIGPASWCWQDIPAGLHNVWLMPFGVDPGLKNAKAAWDLAIKHGYNYSDRLHIRVGGK